MRIADIDRGPASSVKFEANGVETVEFKAETLSMATVDILEYDIIGLHVQDIKELEVGELEGQNLDIIKRYMDIEPLPSDNPDEASTGYSLNNVLGATAIVAYAHPTVPRVRILAIPDRVIETRSIAA